MPPPINRYPKKPLAYNIACKTILYLLMASIIHYLERLIDFSRQAGGLVAGNEKLLTEIVAALLGGANHSFPIDHDVLHRSRTDARHRQGENAAVIFRAASPSGVLNENDGFTASAGFFLEKEVDIRSSFLVISAA